MKLVKVEWVDSYGVGTQWSSLDEVDISDEAHICISVGYLAKKGKNVIVIVPHFSPADNEIGSEDQGCGDMAIPVSAVRKVTELVEKRHSIKV